MLTSKLIGAQATLAPALFFQSLSNGSTSLTAGASCGYSDGIINACFHAGTMTAHIANVDLAGNVVWAKQITHADGLANSIVVSADSSGNVFVFLRKGSPIRTVIAKLNSTGGLDWCRQFYHATDGVVFPPAGSQKALTDSSGNVYALLNKSAALSAAILVKYNSAGAIQWQKVIAHSTVALSPLSLALEPSGDLLAAVSNTTNNDLYVYRVTQAGASTASYGRRGAATGQAYGVFADSSGNIFVGGWLGATNAPGFTKYTSTFASPTTYGTTTSASYNYFALVNDLPVLLNGANDAYLFAANNLTSVTARSTASSVTHFISRVFNFDGKLCLQGSAQTTGVFDDSFVSRLDLTSDVGTYGASKFVIGTASIAWASQTNPSTQTVSSTFGDETYTDASDTITVADSTLTSQRFLKA